MFVHELRGVVFVTWVSIEHIKYALKFPKDKASDWASLIEEMTGVDCIYIPIPSREVEEC